ncbi:MAG: hypothetical protein K0R66_7 [Gammaproteobacteria bacterium]|jgi:hypothetical protein|nr:hypothetical protein [Gammaproteobacteria bacterium]
MIFWNCHKPKAEEVLLPGTPVKYRDPGLALFGEEVPPTPQASSHMSFFTKARLHIFGPAHFLQRERQSSAYEPGEIKQGL